MSGNNPFSRSASRHRSSFFDDDDDGEPFEQEPPPGFFQKTAPNAVCTEKVATSPVSGTAPRPVLTPVAGAAPGTTTFPAVTSSGAAKSAADARGESTSGDTYLRSSETRAGRYGRQVQGNTRATKRSGAAMQGTSEEDADPRARSDSDKPSSKPKRSLRGRALAYLSRREHSRDELARKLTPFIEASDGEDPIPNVLDRLAEEGWLSDARFAESVVNRRASRFGAMRIVGELKRHKVDSDTVHTLNERLRDSEWERISAVWARKFGALPVTQQERAKQARFLASRGFSRDAIMRIIKVGDEDVPAEE